MKQYDIIKNLPDFLQDIKEFRVIADMINPEFELLRRRRQNLLLNRCIADMDADGIARSEKALKITPVSTDTLEDRRFRLMLYTNGDRPYTYDIIDERLKKLCGVDNICTSVDVENYFYGITIGAVTQSQYNEIMKLVNKVLPCNMETSTNKDIPSELYFGGAVVRVKSHTTIKSA